MTQNQNTQRTGDRIFFLDNLRTFMIFLVVLLHAGITYESSGIPAFFWIVDDPATNDLSGLLNLVLDIFVMSTIFFIAGYFTPVSLSRKTGWKFISSKFKRLMIPWLIAAFTLLPLYKVIFLYSRGLPQEHWTTYFHWTNGIWNQNWLWFLPVLFLFDLLYLAGFQAKISFPKVNLWGAVAAALIVGFMYTLSIQIFGLQGWTKTFLVDFQNERLLVYFLVFLLGAHAYRLKIFDSKPKSRKLYLAVSSLAWIPILGYVFLVLVAILKPGTRIISAFGDAVLMQATFCLSLLSMIYLLVQTFRYYFNRQGGLLRALNDSSYGVYIVHVVVLGGIALVLLNVTLPSLLKHLTLTFTTFAVSTILVLLYKRSLSPVSRSWSKPKTTAEPLTQREMAG